MTDISWLNGVNCASMETKKVTDFSWIAKQNAEAEAVFGVDPPRPKSVEDMHVVEIAMAAVYNGKVNSEFYKVERECLSHSERLIVDTIIHESYLPVKSPIFIGKGDFIYRFTFTVREGR